MKNKPAEAQRLLDDPAFQDSTQSVERSIVDKLKTTLLDGKPETERYILELVRTLQSGARYQRLLWQQVDAGKLQEHALEQKKRFKKGGF